jgi:hypothetical protein
LSSKSKGDSIFLKPDKIYLNNINLNYCYCQNQQNETVSTVRETYFANQLQNIYDVSIPKNGDFLVIPNQTQNIYCHPNA